jgi:choline dehydrogenase
MDTTVLIVGAGSAGAVLAARLSEDPSVNVLLLETGPDYRTADRPAAMLAPNPFGIILDPQHRQFRFDDLTAIRSLGRPPELYWRGRGVGGSSAMNGQIAIRGLLEDFDDWAAQGCTGWSGDEVLPYFCKLETDLDFGDLPYHGADGPLPVYRAPLDRWGPIDKALRASALELGYAWSDDVNAPDSTGVTTYPINSIDGVRVSTNDAYLDPIRDRPNLIIIGDAHVDRVLFDGRVARGVRAIVDGRARQFDADQIILSAGAIHTPPILMRSGIGKRTELERFGVPVVADLPVGDNLVEHSAIWLGVAIKPAHRVPDLAFRHTNCCVRYSSGFGGAGRNDMILISMNNSGMDDAGRESGKLIVATFQTFSRGTVRLASLDPNIHPEIDLNMLSDERDLVRMNDGVRRLFALSQQSPFREISDSIFSTVTGEPISELLDGDALDSWLMEQVGDAQHPVGTCRMGSPTDPRTVVDPSCKVVGIERLRVIDASVMPENPRANTHFTTVMIAEKMADVLKESR